MSSQNGRKAGGSSISGLPSTPPPPGQLLRFLPSSLLSHLPGQRHPVPGGELQALSAGHTLLARDSSDFLSWVSCFPGRRSSVFEEDACCLPQSQEQRLFLVLAAATIATETLGKSLAPLEAQFPHW